MKHLLPQLPYFKAALHTHTTISDGTLTPQQLRDAYKEKGFHVLAITDHSVMVSHQELNQPDFLLLTGVEIDIEDDCSPTGDIRGRNRHFCLLSRDPHMQWVPFRDPNPIAASIPYEKCNTFGSCVREYTDEAIQATIDACNAHGCLVTYNHPAWSLENYTDYSPMNGLWGLEHRNTSGISCGFNDDAGQVFQDFLCQGKFLMPVMADDVHSPVATRSGMPVLGGSWTMVAAEKLEYSAVMDALAKGDLYSSCGPEIYSLTQGGATLTLTCSPASRVQMVSQTRFCRVVYDAAGHLTSAQFDADWWFNRYRNDPNAFLRFIVTAADGSYAVTRAYRPADMQA